ncbi:hypothetical protein SKAU_G00005410 [Synaphobranchus kaupii]|uniref:Astrotactin-2 n=1 Tax=Synaphobranchus kaupii TaxID=118154 RepID=A0A9Q1G9V6_SYNKA|nr:hypothetical protein SKAU_G00005410 [Synaphobranchus kaupii]
MERSTMPTFSALFLLGVLLTGTGATERSRGTGMLSGERDRENGVENACEVKTVTVSTLPVLRENEFSFTGGGSGSVAGGGGGDGGTGGGGGGGGGESQLLLFVRTDVPGRISVLDDLDNTALPYFTLVQSDKDNLRRSTVRKKG